MDITNKVVLVTGGASGIGAAVTRKLHAAGACIFIFDINEQKGQEICDELRNVYFYKVDITSETQITAALKAIVDRALDISACINCAGIATASRIASNKGAFPLSLWEETIAINLTGTFNVVRLCALNMITNNEIEGEGHRGVIINISSIAAFDGQVGQAAYSASKGGIVSMTLPLARDLARYGIRVNTIAPGLVDTPIFNTLTEDLKESLTKIPLYPKRLAAPDDIALLALHIVENDYINGECIRIDAGARLQA